MFQELRSSRLRQLYSSWDSLEGRALLNAAKPYHVHQARVPEHVFHTKHDRIRLSASDGPTITPINMIRSHGFMFTNFDGLNAGTVAGTGTNMNGIETLREPTMN